MIKEKMIKTAVADEFRCGFVLQFCALWLVKEDSAGQYILSSKTPGKGYPRVFPLI